jgi:imidazolonepropionase-like amidohydrolase
MKNKAIILRADFLWDGILDKMIPHGAVLLEHGIIQAVGAEREITRLPHDQVIDYPGGTILPGLIDCHTHLSMDPLLDNYLDHMADPVPVLTIRAIRMMKRDLQTGVTTCRCCGDKELLDVACRDAVVTGQITGPHLLVATRGIRAPHGHGFVGYPFDGIDSIRNAIRENAEAGADFIKIYITGTLRGDGSLPSFLSRDQIRTAIEEAHKAGLRIGAHCVGGIGLDWAMELGLDTLEHGYHISDKQIEKLSNSGTRLVITPSPILTDLRVNHLPSDLIPGHLRERDEISDRMRAAILSGIFYAVGTDGMHGELVQEIQYLSELGATSAGALRAATLHGAIVCGIEHKTGSLETGKDGDLLIVDGNPFEDLEVLKRVLAVWKSGQEQSIE